MWNRNSVMSVVVVVFASVAAMAAAEVPDPTGSVIGIDLGSTYSCVGIYRQGRVHIIPNEQGNRITPSYVAFTEDGERLIGDSAKNQATLNPRKTIFDVKRLIGRKFTDKSVQQDRQYLPFPIVNSHGRPAIEVEVRPGETKQFSAEQISAMVLHKMKTIAETYLGTNVTSAIVTVPAYFNDAQRQATVDAGTIAGLHVLRVMNEPTAAAIAYGLNTKLQDKNVLVFDLGGGTFDVTLLSIDEGMFEVLATSGDTHLGGEDFDQRVMQYFIKLIESKHRVDISSDDRAMAKLRREVEKAKRALSAVHSTRIEVEGLVNGMDFSETLTRAKFEELNNDLFLKTLKPVEQVLKDANLQKSDVYEIVLVGGSTRIPKVQSLLQGFFNGKLLNKQINPDEAVAYGAAVQGAVLSTDPQAKDEAIDQILLVDVMPLSVGIETAGGVMAPILSRNDPIPNRKSKTFTTYEDRQTIVRIRVFQGERALTKDNVLLGEFELSGIAPAPRGVPKIEVSFEVDASGIIHVKAVEGGKTGSLTIQAEKRHLSDDDIKRMVEEAKQFAEEDAAAREKSEAINKIEGLAFNIRKQCADKDLDESLRDRLAEEDWQQANDAANEALQWLDSHRAIATVEECEAQRAQLEQVWNPIVSKLYGQGGSHADSTDAGGDDNDGDGYHSHEDEL